MPKDNSFFSIKKLLKRISQLFLALFILLISSSTIDGTTIRGIWVVRTTLTSKENILELVNKAEQAGLEHLFVQVNMSGFAYYRSERLPQAVSSFDPLDFLLKEAHQRGLKVHAWLNAYTVGALGSKPTNSNHVLAKHPDWSLVDIDGVSVLNYPKGRATEALPSQYLEPGLKEVQDWVVENYLEVVRNYQVDGIHFDFIRYPGRDYGYHPLVIKEFEEKFGFSPKDIVTDWVNLKVKIGREKYDEAQKWFDDFRRAQITNVVKRVSEATRKIRPGCIVSTAVFPVPSEAIDQKFQDWFLWLNKGYIDWACPMIYDTEDYILDLRLNEISRRVDKNKVVVGLGPYKDTVEGTLKKIDKVYKERFLGYLLFSYDAIKTSKIWLHLEGNK